MITVIVTFKISDELDADILKEKFIETSTLYQDVTGLRRKNREKPGIYLGAVLQLIVFSDCC